MRLGMQCVTVLYLRINYFVSSKLPANDNRVPSRYSCLDSFQKPIVLKIARHFLHRFFFCGRLQKDEIVRNGVYTRERNSISTNYFRDTVVTRLVCFLRIEFIECKRMFSMFQMLFGMLRSIRFSHFQTTALALIKFISHQAFWISDLRIAFNVLPTTIQIHCSVWYRMFSHHFKIINNTWTVWAVCLMQMFTFLHVFLNPYIVWPKINST